MAANIDLSAQDDRIVDCLAANLHVLYFHSLLTETEQHAAAAKAIKIAIEQSDADTINYALSRLHCQLSAKVSVCLGVSA